LDNGLTPGTGAGTIEFDTDGTVSTGDTGLASFTLMPVAQDITINIDFSQLTQFGGNPLLISISRMGMSWVFRYGEY
jgi:hypothetical protein